MGGSILVVDDEVAIRDLLAANLQRAGYKVMCAGDVPQAEAMVRESRPDLVLLDWVLPGVPGLTFARRLRSDQRTKDISIVLLSARAEEQDKVTALESGADDYVTKPFSVRELIARVRAVLRRADESASASYEDARLRIDFEDMRVACDGEPVKLTRKEFSLLATLARGAGRVATRQQLLDNVWGYEYYGDTRTLDVHIRRLRQKLGPCGDSIETVVGVGYRFVGCQPEKAANRES